MVFTENTILLLSSKKKIDFLKACESKGENGFPSVKLLMRDKVTPVAFYKLSNLDRISDFWLTKLIFSLD